MTTASSSSRPLRKALHAAALAAALLLPAAGARAQDAPDLERVRGALLTLVRTLLDQNILTVAKAEEMLRQAGLDPRLLTAPAAPPAPPPTVAAATPPAPPVVRVPYVSETVKREIREQLRQEIVAQARAERWGDPGALPAWLGRVTLYGDIRLRLQRDDLPDENNAPQLIDAFYQLPADTTRNTTTERDRLRLRARVGLSARLDDDWDAGLRIVANTGGDANNPVSANVDLGRFNRRFGAAFDLAYLGWGRGEWSARGGRIANPYLATDLMWAPDMTFDGLALTWSPALTPAWSAFATLGAHPLHEVAGSQTNGARDKWLLAAQGGLRWQGAGASSVRAALAWYDFRNIAGQLNPALPAGNGLYNDTAPVLRQRGNTMFNVAAESNPGGTPVWGIASGFKVAHLVLGADLGFADPWRLGFTVDWLRNLGHDADDMRARIGAAAAALPQDRTGSTGLDRARTDGFRVEFALGHGTRDQKGSWQVFAGWRQLERDAVPDGFTSASYRLGGTDQKASFVGANWFLARNVALGAPAIAAESLDLAPTYRVNAWLLDLSTRF